jgi:DNA (cytosine-5)-methyltransferase 1
MSAPLPHFKIGVNRGRRRIWLDGKRLLDAGFAGGTTYWAKASEGELLLAVLPSGPDWRAFGWSPRKVTGRPDGKPIIDISGRTVDQAFPAATSVKALFEPGRITLTPA